MSVGCHRFVLMRFVCCFFQDLLTVTVIKIATGKYLVALE